MDRRQYLATLYGGILLGSSGCLETAPVDDTPEFHVEITVQNEDDRPYDVTARITDADDAVVFRTDVRLAPGEGRGYGDDLAAGDYTIEVIVDDRLALRSAWDTDDCDVHRSEVRIAPDGRGVSATRCAAATTTAATA